MIAQARQGWEKLDGARRLIVVAAVGVLLLLIWASLAPLDDITRGQGRVIPSSKVQVVQAADPATVEEILIQNGQQVKRGELLVRLNDSESASQLGQLETETERLSARADRLNREASGTSAGCEPGSVCAEEARLQSVRAAANRSREAALAAAVEQRRRDLREGEATVTALEESTRLAQEQVNMLAPLAAKNIVPQTELLSAQRGRARGAGRTRERAAGFPAAGAERTQRDHHPHRGERTIDPRRRSAGAAQRIALTGRRHRQRSADYLGRRLRVARRDDHADRTHRRTPAGRGADQAFGHRLHQGGRPCERESHRL